MKIPGFTAVLASGRISGHDRIARTSARRGRPAVAAPRGGRVAGVTLGAIADYWPCRDTCYRTYTACLDTCEGTWASPKPSRNCVICDNNYRRCLNRCTSDIA